MDTTTKKEALRAISAHLADGYTVQEIADLLGVSSAHISNVTTQKREPGPTLIKAMVRHHWIAKPPPYRYYKIRRDDPEAAAQQIWKRLGREFGLDLALHLLTLEARRTQGKVIMAIGGKPALYSNKE